MPHHESLQSVHLSHTDVTIGSFDGVHIGHQQLIRSVVEKSHSQNRQTVVITFFPHPAIILRGLQTPYYLTSPDEKANLLLNLGVDHVVTIQFTPELAQLSPKDFMQLAKSHLGVERLWVGYDFALGRNRSGDIPTLKQIGQQLGFELTVLDPVLNGNTTPVSSRQIRGLLSEGNVEMAAKLLGRYYDIRGTIIHGDGRGRLLGIPTTNLQYDPSRLLPRPGVYASLAHVGDKVYQAVTNIGTNPTFINTPLQSLRLETHLLDFSGDLYGTDHKVDFCHFIRPEEKFYSVDALKARIDEDIAFARNFLPPTT